MREFVRKMRVMLCCEDQEGRLLVLPLRSGYGFALSLSKGPYGPSVVLIQPPILLDRLLRTVPFLVTLPLTSFRPSTLPNPNTSGRSRSKGSDCRTVRPTPGVNKLVPGRLGPGSPNMVYCESRDTALDVWLKDGNAKEERRFWFG